MFIYVYFTHKLFINLYFLNIASYFVLIYMLCEHFWRKVTLLNKVEISLNIYQCQAQGCASFAASSLFPFCTPCISTSLQLPGLQHLGDLCSCASSSFGLSDMNIHTPPDHTIGSVRRLYSSQNHMFCDVQVSTTDFVEVYHSNHIGTNNVRHYGGFPDEIPCQFPHQTLFHISSFSAGRSHLYLFCPCTQHHNKSTTSLDGDEHVSNSALCYLKLRGSGHISTFWDLGGH